MQTLRHMEHMEACLYCSHPIPKILTLNPPVLKASYVEVIAYIKEMILFKVWLNFSDAGSLYFGVCFASIFKTLLNYVHILFSATKKLHTKPISCQSMECMKLVMLGWNRIE